MSLRAPQRISLILPVGSGRAILAAIQVVFHRLRAMRVELDLLREPGTADTVSLPQPGAPGAILFVAALSPLAAAGRETEPQREQALRSFIERSYARQGIAPVEYDLEIL
jgi:hypothetical protein